MLRSSSEAVIGAYCTFAPSEILREYPPNCCIAATWITIEVLRQFGVTATPLEVQVAVFNAMAAKWRLTHLAAGQRLTGSWIIGTESAANSDCLGGHLVTLVDSQLILDASLDQANDPVHGIVLPPALCVRLGSRFHRSGTVARRVNNCVVQYTLGQATQDYMQSQYWGASDKSRAALARIMARMRDMLKAGTVERDGKG